MIVPLSLCAFALTYTVAQPISLTASAANQFVSGEIPTDFVSLSLGQTNVYQYFSSTSFVNVMKTLSNINPNQRGPNIRVGGITTDFSVFDANGQIGLTPFPPCTGCQPATTYNVFLTAQALSALSDGVEQLRGTVTMGLNFMSPTDPTQALAVVSAMKPGQVISYEIGNEPSGYNNPKDNIRAAGYLPATYVTEQQTYTTALSSVLTMPKIQGGAFCCGAAHPEWDLALPSYISTFAKDLSSVSYHSYDISSNSYLYQGAPFLLDNTNMMAVVQRFVSIGLPASCAANNVPFVIGEGSTVNNGGISGLSDTYVSSLWALDQMFNFATIGVVRFNFITNTANPFNVFQFPTLSTFKVQPIFYGMWAFAAATASNSKLYKINYSTSNSFTTGQINVYAALATDGVVRVTAVNKVFNSTTPATITVDLSAILPASSLGGNLRRLKASVVGDATVTSGISFGGQSFDNTMTGSPSPALVAFEVVSIPSSRIVTFTLDPLSAAVLEICPSCANAPSTNGRPTSPVASSVKTSGSSTVSISVAIAFIVIATIFSNRLIQN